ncbi:MAG: PEGA domain-containing protein [Dehalococcoidales bacterium]|nr:PEGA domain-containing protein [Dehalococcoidales bacterium]
MSKAVQSSGEQVWRGQPGPSRSILADRRILAGGAAVLLALVLGLVWLFGEGTLTVESTPPGAAVFVGGQSVGMTPLTLRTRLVPASGTLEVRLDQYENHSQPFTVEPRQGNEIAVTLTPLAAPAKESSQVEVTSQPAGAEVYLDGSLVGTAPVTVQDVEPGKTHSLRLTLPNHEQWTQEITTTPGEKASINAQLVAPTAELDVTSTPPQAKVYLDGAERGQTPLVLQGVSAGQHEVKVAQQGFDDWVRKVDLTAGGKSDVQAVLVRAGAEGDTFARPLAFSIDNHPDARWQSGLTSADVVYEALTEGGITRFLGLFMTRPAEVVGPVRSARHYFAYWAYEYDAMYVHCGGYKEAAAAITETGIAEMDDLKGSPGFWRSDDREPPFNLYTSTAAMRAEADRRGLRDDVGSYGGLQFEDTPTMASGQTATELTLYYPYGYYVTWEYVAATNDYLRYSVGVPHVDAQNGEQLRGTNVIVLFMHNWFMGGDDQQDFQLTGTGRALFFQDGVVQEGQWSRDSIDSATRYYDESENEVLLNKGGTTWIQVVPVDAEVDY